MWQDSLKLFLNYFLTIPQLFLNYFSTISQLWAGPILLWSKRLLTLIVYNIMTQCCIFTLNHLYTGWIRQYISRLSAIFQRTNQDSPNAHVLSFGQSVSGISCHVPCLLQSERRIPEQYWRQFLPQINETSGGLSLSSHSPKHVGNLATNQALKTSHVTLAWTN